MEKEAKTALVTDANRGLGLETARELAGRGWGVIVRA
jgi:NAD(P)-dependent dehydrogenase (short-subunit alcohol dehydrogenase family)